MDGCKTCGRDRVKSGNVLGNLGRKVLKVMSLLIIISMLFLAEILEALISVVEPLALRLMVASPWLISS